MTKRGTMTLTDEAAFTSFGRAMRTGAISGNLAIA
jgi:hypothetical protein